MFTPFTAKWQKPKQPPKRLQHLDTLGGIIIWLMLLPVVLLLKIITKGDT